MNGNGFVIAIAEDFATQNVVLGYWDGSTLTDGATATDLNEAEFYNDSDTNEQDLMQIFANVQLANSNKYVMLKRASVQVTLV